MACQKTSRNNVPMLVNRTANTLIAIAAWVRFDEARGQQPERPEAERRHDQDDVAAQDVVRGDAAVHEHAPRSAGSTRRSAARRR